MNRYTLEFLGRKNGAIGIFYPMRETIDAPDIDTAWRTLAERFETLHRLNAWTEVLNNG